MIAGACISGQARTFFLPCIGPQIRDNLLLPLNLRTHVFIHGKNVTETRVRAALRGANLATVIALPPQSPSAPCPTKRNGYRLTLGLFFCYRAIAGDTVEYTWVVRLRTDNAVPFRMVSLPDAAAYYSLHPWATGIALLASLGNCNCGWRAKACDPADRVYCGWVDDQFGLLHGNAIKEYLHDLHVFFCDRSRLGVPGGLYLNTLDSEARLARFLRNSTVHDMRFISAAVHPRLQRSQTCGRPTDGQKPLVLRSVLRIPRESIETPLPDGPWDQRRDSVCKEQRAKKHPRLCLPYDGRWDNEVFLDSKWNH